MRKIFTVFVLLSLLGLSNIFSQLPTYIPSNGLISYWPFNGNANDASGNGYNGTVNGATLTTDRFGYANSAFSFTNNSISFSNSNFAAFGSGSFSCSVWAKYTNSGNSLGNFVRYGNGVSGAGWGMRYTGNSLVNCLEYNVTNNNVTSTLPYNNNNWHNIVFVRDVSNKTIVIYIDGALINTFPMISGTINNISNGLPFNIGTANGYESFVGQLDDIGTWNRALTQQEITSLFVCNQSTCTNIALNKPATANSTFSTFTPDKAFDGNISTRWENSSNTGWIQVDLQNLFTVDSVKLNVNQTPSGNTIHEIKVSSDMTNWITVKTLSGYTQSGQIITSIFYPALTSVRGVKINTTSSPSWVAWNEIEVYSCGNLCLPPNVPMNGLMGWWPFCDNSNDESGNGNNGTVNGATLTSDRYGNANKAYNFNGVSDNITIANFFSDTLPELTYSAWFMPNEVYSNSDSKTFTIISNSSGVSGQGYDDFIGRRDYYGVKPFGYYSYVNYGYQYDCSTSNTTTLNQNIWYHVVTTRNGSLMNIYINGQLEGTLNYTGIVGDGNRLSFGGHVYNTNSGHWYFNGKIDDIGVWNRILTSQEITNLYNSNVTSLNFENINNNSIKIFPNPSNGKFTIDFGNQLEMKYFSLKITNLLGQIVYVKLINSSQTNIDLYSSVVKGIYFVHLIDEQSNIIEVRKIVLQ